MNQLEATARADELVRGLGEGWTSRVWENIGWHYSAQTDDRLVRIHPSHSGGYTAFLSPDGSGGGRWVGSGRTPREALMDAEVIAVKELSGVVAVLASVRKGLHD